MIITNLCDILHIFLNDPGISRTQKAMTKTAVRYVVRAMGVFGSEDIAVSAIPRSLEKLKEFLANNSQSLSPNTVRNYTSSYSRLIAWARDRRLLPQTNVSKPLPEWVTVSSPIKNCTSGRRSWRDAIRKLGYWSSSFGLTPAQLTPLHLMDYQNYLREESSVKAWRQMYNRAKHEWELQAKQGTLPPLSWPPLPTGAKSTYALPLRAWPQAMQEKYEQYRRWSTSPFEPERDRRFKQRAVSAAQNLSMLQRITGYAHSVLGIPVEELSLEIFFDKKLVTSYFSWLVEHRLGGVTVTLERIAASLLAMARGYFKRDDALTWLLELKEQVRGAPVRDKKSLMVSLEELERVADGIGNRRIEILAKANREGRKCSPIRQGQLFRDELIVRILIARPLRQRNMREMKLGKNLFKDDDNIWQLRFSGTETKAGNLITFDFPENLVEYLEKYLRVFRPILLNNHHNDWVFPSPNGRHICARTVQRIFTNNSRRVLGRHLYPHLVRDIAAYQWLKNNPRDFLTVSRLLGHEDVNTTLQLYGHFDGNEAAQRYDELLRKISNRTKDKNHTDDGNV